MQHIPYIEIGNYLSPETAWKYRVIPKQFESGLLTLLIDTSAYRDSIIGELELVTGHNIALVREEPDTIDALLNKIYRKGGRTQKPLYNLANDEDFLFRIIYEAKELQSSDIHVESYAEKCRIRLRIDGKLLERYHIPKAEYASFINKIKIKARLDIAEKRLPQDGRILHTDGAVRTDIRVSTLPTLYGEKIVLRLLSNDASHIDLGKLGFDEFQLSDFCRLLKKPHGIILISGPTGSGKTTTLYATLKLLNKEDTNILTIEDPIEYTLEGINQVQLKESIGLTFASALRTFLRQDPDVVMLGEIRDGETAQMAIRAALTGHLVLATIHTNSAWGTISRLVDMGVPSFLLSSTINLTVAQRLVRVLCSQCKAPDYAGTDDYIKLASDPSKKLYKAVGCANCYETGYQGRVALYEVIPVNRELSHRIKDNTTNISDYLKKERIATLREKALDLLYNGITSVDEIYPILLNE